MTRRYAGRPGLTVSELVAAEEGTSDLSRGFAPVYVKEDDPVEHPVGLHEYLASRLAHSMGVPVPFGELASIDDRGRAWATAVVGPGGQPPPPGDVRAAAHAEPHVFAGIWVFDLWIHNVDRWEENILWTEDLGLWAIDHERAFGQHNPKLEGSLLEMVHHREPPFSQAGVEPAKESMRPWVDLVMQNGRRWAEAAVSAAYRRELQSKRVLDEYETFLVRRARAITQLAGVTGPSGTAPAL